MTRCESYPPCFGTIYFPTAPCCVYGEPSADWRLHKVLHLVKGRGYRST